MLVKVKFKRNMKKIKHRSVYIYLGFQILIKKKNTIKINEIKHIKRR